MDLEVDVSGEDIFDRDYTICVASKEGKFRGFKFGRGILKNLKSRQGQGMYRYGRSKKQRSLFKIRIYSIIVYYLIKDLNLKKNINLEICRDFEGHEGDIKTNLKYFLGTLLGLEVEIRFVKLLRGKSLADKYASLMRLDKNNKLLNYTRINLEDLEKFLK